VKVVRKFQILLLILFLSGCGAVKERKVITIPPAYRSAQTASLQQLIDLINTRYAGIHSLIVPRLTVEFTGRSMEEGYFEKYRKADGYLVAEEPDSVFLNILNPLTHSSVLVMASRAEHFEIWIPSRNQFVTGRTSLKSSEENPVYNVRPLHILQGILIEAVSDQPEFRYSLEEEQDAQYKYYVLDVFRTEENSQVLQLLRKIWIERSQLRLARQQTYQGPRLVSTVTYSDPVDVEGKLVSTRVNIDRPVDGYSIAFTFEANRLQLNRPVKEDAFKLQQPPGAEVIQVDEGQ
jgi:outer membrane lipoprotein-sorting protein